MKIGIYNAPGGEGVGGAELCAVVLADALAAEHDVEIVHHKASLDAAGLSTMFGVDLPSGRLRYVPSAWKPYGTSGNPLQRYRESKAWQAELSRPYDVFIAFTHDVPPFCHASKGILVVLFAAHEREDLVMFRADRSKIAKHLKHLYHRLEWRARMRGYQRRFAISEFTREWTKRRWQIDTDILHPPAGEADGSRAAQKQPLVLSVGRFTTHGHSKRQREMMEVFASLDAERAQGWRYASVGGLTPLADDRRYFDEIAARASTCDASVAANCARSELDRLFSTASVFWHASGYGVDESSHPELVEHYGISTVEAMTAGCVPVVIDTGGQREIVEHGVSGFLWKSLDELRDLTSRLMRDDALRSRMSAAAVERARLFSRDAFVARAKDILASLSVGR